MNKKALVLLVANLIFCSGFPIGGYNGNGDNHGNGGHHGNGNDIDTGNGYPSVINGNSLIDNFEDGDNEKCISSKLVLLY